jgi:hypothetical protein
MGTRKNYQDIFEQFRITKEILSPVVEELEDEKIKVMLSRIVNYLSGRKVKFIRKEMELYDFILMKGLKPRTLYKYYLANEYPEAIQKQLKEKKIGFYNAQSKVQACRRMKDKKESNIIINEVRKIIGGLEWQNL